MLSYAVRMIVGVGLDVCDVKRLRRAMARSGFTRRVFDDGEVRDCDRRARRHLHYAARFAAKEACFKALGTGWGAGVGWQDVLVESDGEHPPRLRLRGGALRQARSRGIIRSHLSMSHSGDYAVAVVILEGAAPARSRRR